MTRKHSTQAGQASVAGIVHMKGDTWIAALYLFPGIFGLLIFVLGPLVASMWLSLTDWSLAKGMNFIGLDNYIRLLTKDRIFWRVLQNTLVIAFIFVPLNLALATLMAVWLKTPLKGRGFLRVIFLLPCLTPMVANALIWRFILADDGLVNQTLALVDIQGPVWLGSGGWAMFSIILVSLWQSFGYNMIVLGAGLNAIDSALYDAARIDGVGPIKRFFHLTLPLLSPSLFFCAVMTMIAGFQIFAQPYVMTKGGPGQDTNTLVLYLYQNAFAYDSLGFASALGWIVFSLVMVVTALQFTAQRRLVHYA